VRGGRRRHDLDASAGVRQPPAEVAVVEEQRKALVQRDRLELVAARHDASGGGAEDRDRLTRRAAGPQVLVATLRRGAAAAAAGVDPPPDGRVGPQHAGEADVAAGV